MFLRFIEYFYQPADDAAGDIRWLLLLLAGFFLAGKTDMDGSAGVNGLGKTQLVDAIVQQYRPQLRAVYKKARGGAEDKIPVGHLPLKHGIAEIGVYLMGVE